VYDDVPKSSTRHRGAFRLPVPPSSLLMPPVSLEKLLAPLNTIVQWLNCQSRQSQSHQQPQESSYIDFLATQPPEFAEAMDPLDANHWLRVTEES
jgi:hypothetical protein